LGIYCNKISAVVTVYAKETYVWFSIISVPIIVRDIGYTLLRNNAKLGKIIRVLFRLEILPENEFLHDNAISDEFCLEASLEKPFSNDLCVFTVARRSILESYMARSE
jgi:hypothetical protein